MGQHTRTSRLSPANSIVESSPMMSSRIPARFLGGLVALLIAVVPISGSTTMLLRAVQIDGSRYESPHFAYVVEWDQRWAGLDRHVVSLKGDRD